jgi:Tfp pilus assembly protein PilV
MTKHLHTSQRGATLTIAMIMLVLLTLFVLATMNMTNMNLRVMGNEQARNEALAAGQQAIEQVASTNFPANPQPVTVNVDVNHDGTNDYTVAVARPVCQNAIPIKLVELDVAKVEDVACFGSGVSPAPGLPLGGGSGNSLCANTQWDVSAHVTDVTANTGTDVTVHQGLGQRVPIGTTC